MADKRKKFDVQQMRPERVKSIAERYVTDYENYTIADLCKIYGLSKHYFRQIIKRAITENLISYQMCVAIRDKSCGNQQRHFEKGRGSAPSYYMTLFDERFQFVKSHEDPAKTRAFAKNYISTNATIGGMAYSVGLSPREMFYFITKGAVIYFTNLEFDMFIKKLEKQFAHDTFLAAKIEKIRSFRATYTNLLDQIEIDDIQLASLVDDASSEDDREDREGELEKHRAELANQLERFKTDPLY